MRQTHILKKLGCFLLGFTLVASFSACGEKRPGGSSVGPGGKPSGSISVICYEAGFGTKWLDEMAKQLDVYKRQVLIHIPHFFRLNLLY